MRGGRMMVATILLLCGIVSGAAAQDPVDNVRWYRVDDSRLIIYYDLASAIPCPVTVRGSLDDGATFTVTPQAISGDVGGAVQPGQSLRIEWDVSADGIDPDVALIPRVTTGMTLVPSVLVGVADTAESLLGISSDRVVAACGTDLAIRRDGVLSEPAWKQAVPATGFLQREPNQGEPATERTEVKILYDATNLYIGVICYDSEPNRIVHNELELDGELRHDDNFTVVLDTFHDHRNGFYFRVNANGARQDAKVEARANSGNSGRRFNDDWNGIWDVAARITDEGWVAEIEIPFRTLRFTPADIQEWGINFQRDIVRKSEETLWSAWSRDDGLLQLSQAGSLCDLESIQRGSRLEAIPYVLAGVERNLGDHDTDVKYGLDLKYPITSDLSLDLTTFTDFAHVEADREQINLTRFDLRYPEKRDFFLEGADIFQFSSTYTSPFYSRNIGLTEDGDQVPILGGGKITGKTGRYKIGVLNIQTDAQDSISAANYSVVRIQRDMLDQSDIGFIATNISTGDNYSEQSYGADFSFKSDKFLGDRNISISADYTQNRKPDDDNGEHGGRFSIQYPNDLMNGWIYYKDVSDNYDPTMGFVQRNGIKQYMVNFGYTPRPDLPFVRQLEFRPVDVAIYADRSGRTESREIDLQPFGLTTTSDDRFSINIKQYYEYLDENFDIHDDVTIPVGEYEWLTYGARFRSNASRMLSCSVTLETGEFYDGERTTIESTYAWKMNRHLMLETEIQYNDLVLDNRSFQTEEYALRLHTNISPRVNARTYVQWNNEDNEINLNFRFRFIPRIGSDFYLVYNHLWSSPSWRRYRDYDTLYNAGISKIAWHITF
jgi:hypothetical protein